MANRKSLKKDRQYNGQQKKSEEGQTIQWPTEKGQKDNNDQQNST